MLTSLHDNPSWRCPADLNARSIAHRGVLHWGCYDCCHNLQLSICSIWLLTFSEGRKRCFRTVKSFHQLKAMQLWGYSLTNVMINKLRISNTVCTSHRILLEHLGPNQETTDTGFPALNKVRTYALRIAGLGIYVSHYSEHNMKEADTVLVHSTHNSLREEIPSTTNRNYWEKNNSFSWEF